MREKNPLEDALSQISDLLHQVHTHQGSISKNLTPSVLDELERLEKSVANFDEINKKAFEEANIDIKRLRDNILRTPNIPENDKQIIQKIREVQKDAREIQASYKNILDQVGKKSSSELSEEDLLKQQIKDRRKKFKRLGENKKWIPL